MKTIPLSNSDKLAIVDDDRYDELSKHNWYIMEAGYVATTYGGKTHLMHRVIIGEDSILEVDHIDNDKLNNYRENLRYVLRSENAQRAVKSNKTNYKGVCFDAQRNKYLATIRIRGKKTNLGRYATAEEAAIAYDKAALAEFGELAGLNNVRPEKQLT